MKQKNETSLVMHCDQADAKPGTMYHNQTIVTHTFAQPTTMRS